MSSQETIQEIQININKAVKALEASTKQHLIAVTALSDLAAGLDNLNSDIAIAKIDLHGLGAEKATTILKYALELNSAKQENETQVLTEILGSRNQVAVDSMEYKRLVSDEQGDLHTQQHRLETAVEEAQHKVENAQLNVHKTADTKHIEQLKAQLASLESKAKGTY